MAVAPLPNVRAVVEYALTEIPAEKLWLGVPNYGYDWPLPFLQGETRATSISPQYAVSLAARYRSSISYDETAQAPWFRYTDENGTEHEVWFEDARSIRAKLSLIPEYGLDAVSYTHLDVYKRQMTEKLWLFRWSKPLFRAILRPCTALAPPCRRKGETPWPAFSI